MRVLVLGAGQDVGRSCVVVRMGGKTLMFDCGMHMGYADARRWPDFSLLGPSHDYTSVIDAVFISHFHMDHVGALPYFTEVCGYDGPVFMTHPTRAIAPIMLHDFYKALRARAGTGPIFAEHHIDAAMAKVRLMDLQETVQVCEGVEVTAYYAGHVLGAAMLHVKAGSESLVYTGDFNTVPERHLSGASIPRLNPDLLITESTYATSIREDRRSRERQLLNMIHQTVTSGGKVLVPVFAVGRAQELLMLLDEHWQRTELQVPIYVSSSMASRANAYFKLLQNWASERVKQAAPGCRAAAFDLSRVQDWNPELLNEPGACVLFATPGMLHGGTSLEVFKAWAPDPKNLVLLPSYQVAGTVGRKLMMGVRQGLQIDAKTRLDVRCKVDYAALSAHTDAKGILQIVQQVAPAAVMLVHGETDKMSFMCDKIQRSLGLPCFMPANGEEVQVEGGRAHNLPVQAQILRQLPASVQQLQQMLQPQQQLLPQGQHQEQGRGQEQEQGILSGGHGGTGVEGGVSVGQAASNWLQQGDVGQLAAAAVQLAAAAGDPGVAGQADQQQQERLVQLHGTPAAARAAQLAPWLELLAAAAQDVRRQQQPQPQQEHQPDPQQQLQQQQQHVLQQGGSRLKSSRGAGAAQQQEYAGRLQSSLVSVATELQQHLLLEQQAMVVDGVLLVHHPPPSTAAAGGDCQGAGIGQQQVHQQPQQVVRMELLPAEAAAAVLHMQQHRVKLSCKLKLPPGCWGGASQGSRDPTRASAENIEGALREHLPDHLSKMVISDGEGTQQRVCLGTVVFEHAAKACVDQPSCWKCSWDLSEDCLAQQCVEVVQQLTVQSNT